MLSIGLMQAQNSPKENSPAGDWTGVLLFAPGQPGLTLNLHLTDNGGNWSATLDSPDQGAYGIPATQAAVRGDSIFVAVKGLMLSYKAKFAAPESLVGTFKQGGASAPLTLKRGSGSKRRRPQEPEPPTHYRTREVQFPGGADGVMLAGTLTTPQSRSNATFPLVICLSGSGPQDRNEEVFGHKPFLIWADYLTRHGIAVLRFDDRGVNGSTGDYTCATVEDFCADALAAVAYARRLPSVAADAVFLLGHSEGALVAAMAAAQEPAVRGILLIGAPVLPLPRVLSHQARELGRQMGISEAQLDDTQALNEACYALAADSTLSREEGIRQAAALFKPFATKYPGIPEAELLKSVDGLFSAEVRSLLRLDPAPIFGRVHCPILLLQGEKDTQVLPENAHRLKAICPQAEVKIFPELNHLLQPAVSGLPSEYTSIETTVDPNALECGLDGLRRWLAGRFDTP